MPRETRPKVQNVRKSENHEFHCKNVVLDNTWPRISGKRNTAEPREKSSAESICNHPNLVSLRRLCYFNDFKGIDHGAVVLVGVRSGSLSPRRSIILYKDYKY